MKCVVLTLFPKEMKAYFLKGIMKKAYEAGHFDIRFKDLREYAQDPFRKVDDYPFGGRRGLILRADVIVRAVKSIEQYGQYRLLYACPKGPVFNADHVMQFKNESKGLIFICGYYEGLDERVFEFLPVERFSLGSFVLSSGELPVLAMLDAVMRTLPGVLGNPDCVEDDSLYGGLLEHPQYTYPQVIETQSVPPVVLSGHHEKIAQWKRVQSLEQSLWMKPDLFDGQSLSLNDQRQLTEILQGEKQ